MLNLFINMKGSILTPSSYDNDYILNYRQLSTISSDKYKIC